MAWIPASLEVPEATVGCLATTGAGGAVLAFEVGGPRGSTALGGGAPGVPALGGGRTSERLGGIVQNAVLSIKTAQCDQISHVLKLNHELTLYGLVKIECFE